MLNFQMVNSLTGRSRVGKKCRLTKYRRFNGLIQALLILKNDAGHEVEKSPGLIAGAFFIDGAISDEA